MVQYRTASESFQICERPKQREMIRHTSSPSLGLWLLMVSIPTHHVFPELPGLAEVELLVVSFPYLLLLCLPLLPVQPPAGDGEGGRVIIRPHPQLHAQEVYPEEHTMCYFGTPCHFELDRRSILGTIQTYKFYQLLYL